LLALATKITVTYYTFGGTIQQHYLGQEYGSFIKELN